MDQSVACFDQTLAGFLSPLCFPQCVRISTLYFQELY
jgi:hypothetical protein